MEKKATEKKVTKEEIKAKLKFMYVNIENIIIASTSDCFSPIKTLLLTLTQTLTQTLTCLFVTLTQTLTCLFGISQTNLNELQRIQNSLARVITNTLKYQHITPTLKKLHWLPIKQRIDYKTSLLTYKTLTNQQPTYLYNCLSFPSNSVSTRSSDSLVLSIPYVRLIITWQKGVLCHRSTPLEFTPPDTRNSSSLPIYRSRLKTHLFKIVFPP